MHARRTPVRRGFSFVEILFAVMILGIGFIMVAAIFPVAISQSQATVDETTAERVLVAADNTVRAVVPDPTQFGATGTDPLTAPYYSFRDPRLAPAVADAQWAALRALMINETDPRFAWTAVYSRGAGAVDRPNIIYFALGVRNRDAYDATDIRRYPTDTATTLSPATVEPKLVNAYLTEAGDGGTDTIEFLPPKDPSGGAWDDSAVYNDHRDAVAEGSYVLISDDRAAPPLAGRMNGRIYRVSSRSTVPPNVVGGQVWDLSPGFDLAIRSPGPDAIAGSADDYEQLPPRTLGTDPTGSVPARVFVIGRGWEDPTAPGTYSGGAQDIAYYIGN
ncbi:MAG TPA: type II secretion system protein [Tepidisphaeraceae bacterium]|nr:type II secretion system protein [Tepidisphaeraceae bacterium]